MAERGGRAAPPEKRRGALPPMGACRALPPEFRGKMKRKKRETAASDAGFSPGEKPQAARRAGNARDHAHLRAGGAFARRRNGPIRAAASA